MNKIPATKVTFKGGGFVVVTSQEDLEIQSKNEDLESVSPATNNEIKEYTAHQNFMKLAQRYIDLIEEWVAERPPITERFRYDSNDIVNMMAFLMKNKEPVKKKEVEVISRAEFKTHLEKRPFEVINGGGEDDSTT